jgi:osmotically inducible protein OsmC
MKRYAQAYWKGTGLEGSGKISTQSQVLNNQPYSLQTRFKDESGKSGTNPEELLAAAHAACFNMALSFMLNGAGYTAESLETKAVVDMDTSGKDFRITQITLMLEGKVAEISEDKFKELAENAKKNCPISAALASVSISLESKLI